MNKINEIHCHGKLRNFTTPLLLCLVLLSVFGCASNEKVSVDLVWPPSPEEPRIKYLDIFRTNLDVEETGFASSLFGEEDEIGMTKPYGVSADREGRVYVADVGAVFVFDKKNKSFDMIGRDPGLGAIRYALGIAVASDGRKFVTDVSKDKVLVYTAENRYLAAYGKPGEFINPSGIALDEKRQIFYVADPKTHLVKAFSMKNGDLVFKIEGGPDKLHMPTNIAIDKNGNIYVVDTGLFKVLIFTPDGKFIKSIGSVGDSPGSFARPKGIAIDSEDNIYVVDAAFQNVQIFNKEGRLLMYFGDSGFGVGRFIQPAGISIDQEDRVYVVDQVGQSVQIFQYMGNNWKKRQAEGKK